MLETETGGSALTMFEEALHEFNKESFLYGDEPYEFANQVISEYPVYQPQIEAILAAYAKGLGLTKQLVTDKMKSMRKIVPLFKDEQAVQWDGAPFPIKVGNYVVEDDIIREQNGSMMVPVCSHPILPVRRYIDIETGEESIDLSYKRDGRWNTITVEKAMISDAGKIVPLSGKGISVTSENARALVRFLNYVDDRNRSEIPLERISSHVGWVSDKEFVPYAPGIGYGGIENFRQMYETIRPGGDYDQWLKILREVRGTRTSVPIRMALAASFASPLLKPFNALPFILHLWSPVSGTGKTVTLEIAASVWGRPGVGDYVRSLKATTVAIEQLAVFTRHLPLILDELQTIQNQSDFDTIIYMLCEGFGKSRGAKNGGLRASSGWQNVTITSGEMPIIGSASKAGAINRVIEVGVQDKLFKSARQTHIDICTHYGHAGRIFIEALPRYMDEARLKLAAFEDALRGQCTDKQALSAAMLLLGDWLSEKIIFQDGRALGVDDILPYLKTDYDVDTNRRAHEWLSNWVSMNHTAFAVKNGPDETGEIGIKLYGLIDNEPAGGQTAWIIVNVFNSAMQEEGYNPVSYRKWAHSKGILRLGANGKETPVVNIKGNRARCIGIKLGTEEAQLPARMEVAHDVELPF